MRVLMTPVSDRPESRSALNITLGLAKKLSANVVGCHLRPSRDKRLEYAEKSLLLPGGSTLASLRELEKKTTQTVSDRARETFEQLVDAAGFTRYRRPRKNLANAATWLEKVGTPDRIMSIVGPLNDLIVVSRTASKGTVARLFMLAALLHSGRPVLVNPPGRTAVPGKTIAIAWNQSPESARVVYSCMPLLQQAQHVTIISAGRENRPGPKSLHLAAYLKYYGIDASRTVTRGKDVAAELMSACKDDEVDLVLMGAYSRPRLRELVFGGLTEYMLRKSTLPVVMQHT